MHQQHQGEVGDGGVAHLPEAPPEVCALVPEVAESLPTYRHILSFDTTYFLHLQPGSCLWASGESCSIMQVEARSMPRSSYSGDVAQNVPRMNTLPLRATPKTALSSSSTIDRIALDIPRRR